MKRKKAGDRGNVPGGQFDQIPRAFLSDEIVELLPLMGRRMERGDGLWDLWRRALVSGKGGMYLACKTVFNNLDAGEDLLTFRTHGMICSLMEQRDMLRWSLLYPRRALKSTISSERKPVLELMRDVVEGRDPNKRYFSLSYGLTRAQLIWWGQKELFESEKEGGRLFRFLFGEDLRPSEKWNEELGAVVRAWDRPDKTFEPLAKRSAGKHCDGLIGDDLIDEENYDEPGQVEKANKLLRLGENWLEGPRSWRGYVGNRWGLVDVGSELCREADLTGEVVLVVSAEKGLVRDGMFGSHNLPPIVEEIGEMMDEVVEETGSFWPERFPLPELEKLAVKLKRAIYSAQMLNFPEDPENQDFDMSLVGSAVPKVDGERGLVYELDGVNGRKSVAMKDMNVYVGWDPAADGKRGKSKNAVIALGTTTEKDVVVLKEHVRKEDPLKTVEKYIAMCRLFRGYLKGSGVEEVNFQRVFKRILRDRAIELGAQLMMRKVKTPTGKSKKQRIRAEIGAVVEAGRLYISVQCPKTRDSLTMFGIEGAEDDPADAMAMAKSIAMYPRKVGEEEEEEWGDEWKEDNAGVSGYGESLEGGRT